MTSIVSFSSLGLSKPVIKALHQVGYETPSPIQAQTIPPLLLGKDVIGQAQTGTGKTAAFALPILTRLKKKLKTPQALVLTPTRELAIQVAEAFKTYASYVKGFHVLPVYGGQEYRGQSRSLKRGVEVVVGTPGRVMDHIRRKTLVLDQLSTLVLDEADEMLRMGFIDDVEWILEQSPEGRQIALFSATMPKPILQIATRHLDNPEKITIKVKTATADTVRQRYWSVTQHHKLDALTRILEVEEFDGTLIFVRTKTATLELAEKLEARGYACAPLNGDIPQNQRERTVEQIKKGQLDILVATDVAARGLDVERISHVINYDIPYDTEAYIHRIGRTGRAGRIGDAILLVTPREKRMLRTIEKATRQKITVMEPPSTDAINERRVKRFKQRISDTLESEEIDLFCDLVEQYQREHETSLVRIAGALARISQGDAPFLLTKKSFSQQTDAKSEKEKPRGRAGKKPSLSRPNKGMRRYKVEVGRIHDVSAGNIVGAIVNEGGIHSKHIGRVRIFDDHSYVDLAEDLEKGVISVLKKTWVSGRRLSLSPASDKPEKTTARKPYRKSKDTKPASRQKAKQPTSKRSKKKQPTKRASKKS